jgi:ABC-type cobalamin transport system permease subunit
MIPRILKFEILGIFFISLLGSFLHFTFVLANKFWLVGTFSAVNESTWEHLKLAVVPSILWMILENKFFKLKANNFLFAKSIGIYLMPILIIVLFYSYTAILGYNLLFFDISTFIIAVIIGQIVSYKIMLFREFSEKSGSVWVLALVILFLAFVIFTFYPPHNFLFRDPVSGLYGIIK